MSVSPMTLPISENAPAAKMPRPAPASASEPAPREHAGDEIEDRERQALHEGDAVGDVRAERCRAAK